MKLQHNKADDFYFFMNNMIKLQTGPAHAYEAFAQAKKEHKWPQKINHQKIIDS